ncbi:hypothetical protein BDW59DRAFT_149120 [Aspergillus cavernicola]|uniref:F-box domain-containing protein n=1 Tax=Aspergillus cavernicola TaxID=176166 RepID=A0ABR4I4V5_9EURO
MLHYCVICGVLISRTSAVPGTVPTDLEWYQQLRVIQLYDDLANGPRPATKLAPLSGVGFVNLSDRITAPLDHGYSFKDDNANLESYTPFYDPELGTWCFNFHALCWDILLQRVPEALSDITKFSTIFFQTLFCTAWGGYRCIRPGHDYGGAAQFQKPLGNPIRNMIHQGFAHLLDRPSQFRDIPEILLSLSQDTQSCIQRPAHITVRSPFLGHDIFSSLPVEVLLLIISILPSADIQQLRLASRSVASVTDPASLPQSFWRSRFCADFEMGFASPINTFGNQNWHDTYFTLKYALRDSSSSSSARPRNRRRIWNLAGINAALLAQRMVKAGLHGSPCTENTRLPPRADTLTHDPSPGTMIMAQLFEDRHDLLRSGSRRLHDRAVVLPLDECAINSIRISTVLFNSQEFISGLQFQLLNPSTQTLTNISLGYMSPNANHFIEIAPSVRVIGFELAICARGVTGVRVVVDSDYRGPQPQWVGDTGNGEVDIAFGMLSFGRKKAQQIRLIASFDAFKIIALGITEGSDPVSGIANSLTSQPIWTPSYPRETVSLVPHLQSQPRLQTFNPVLNLDFGGPNGERLPRLTRIVTHMLNKLAPIVGLTFYLNDQSYIHFGQQGSMEVSSFVDGPGGEFISSVIVEKSPKNGQILLYRMRTNLGSELVSGWDELEDSTVTEGRPLRLLDPTSPNLFDQPEEETPVEILEAPAGQQITGFTATLEAENGSFLTFGLQCERVQPPSGMLIRDGVFTNSVSTSARLASSLGSYFISEASNQCRAYTSAALQSVSYIRFSGGSARRPRRNGEVSGLWFDYYGSRSSTVGQWFSEDASMSLERREIITGITIWLSNDRKSFSEKYYMGRVVRVLISTSLRAVSYPDETPLPTNEHTVLRFQENRLEELSSLVWVFNDAWDFPRVIPSLKSSGGKMTFWHWNQFLDTRPWAAPQRALWAGATEADKVVSITGYHGHSNQDHITGLKFGYLSGASRDIGDVSGRQAHRPVQFDPNEEIRKVSLLTDEYALLQIIFHCSKGNDSEEIQHAIVDPPPAVITPPMSSKIDHLEVEFSQRRYRLHYTGAEGGVHSEANLPEGKVVGIWGFTMPDEVFVVGFVLSNDSLTALA